MSNSQISNMDFECPSHNRRWLKAARPQIISALRTADSASPVGMTSFRGNLASFFHRQRTQRILSPLCEWSPMLLL